MKDARELLASLRERDVMLWGDSGRLEVDAPTEVLTPDLVEELRQRKFEVLEELSRDAKDDVLEQPPHGQGDLLQRFLTDATIPAAVFHSRALGRPFVFARGEESLQSLTEADRGLPVLFFGEAEKLRGMGLDGLRVLLDFRAEFGPSACLTALERRRAS